MAKYEKTGGRSQAWFARGPLSLEHRGWLRSNSVPTDHFDGRPVIGICNTWSELTPCNSHFRIIAQHVREGILEAGGVPMEFPVISTGEMLTRPTAMLLRNLASMDVEESIRANPLDGVVLLMGCDKTSPALLMGAASVNLPTIGVSGGPMLNGSFRGRDVGVADAWKITDQYRAGEVTDAEMLDLELGLSRSHGTCNVMGTASTMASMVEVLGLGLPNNAAIPAVDARRNVLARMAGRRIVDLVREGVVISQILTREAFENAIRVNVAIGGSTNAVIHLTALARRVGVELSIDDWDKLASGVPTLANIQPSGRFLMQDFHEAGGLPAIIRDLAENGLLHRDALTVTGKSLWENNREARCWNPEVIYSVDKPFMKDSGIAVLRGNLCPEGAVIKPSAGAPALLQHTGRAVVFEDLGDMHRRVEDPNLDIDATCVMVLKNCGPRGFPGMPELGNIPIPSKLLKSAVGGPLALVKDGDRIELNVPERRLSVLLSDEELASRRAAWTPRAPVATRGYAKLYIDHVNQAHEGADFDFLIGASGPAVDTDSH